MMRRNPIEHRFWERVQKLSATECWEWTAMKNQDGYGRISIHGRFHCAHRVAYELCVGTIPPGMQVDHLCHNKGCCNPAHLRLATPLENAKNRNLNSNSTSGYKGVCWNKVHKKWSARIQADGKRVHLGWYDSPEDAFFAYKDAATRLHGEFANTGAVAA